MKSLLNFSAILLLLFIGNSCSSSDDNNSNPNPSAVITTFTATLTPVSGITSPASGSASLEVNETTKTFKIIVNYTGLTPTQGHIHNINGDPVIPFPSSTLATSPFTVSGSITDALITELKTGTDYVNLHTDAHINGEISGTLTKTGTSGGGGGGGGGGY